MSHMLCRTRHELCLQTRSWVTDAILGGRAGGQEHRLRHVSNGTGALSAPVSLSEGRQVRDPSPGAARGALRTEEG